MGWVGLNGMAKKKEYSNYEDRESFITERDKKFDPGWIDELKNDKRIDKFLQKITSATKIILQNIASLLSYKSHATIISQIGGGRPSLDLLELLVPEEYLEEVKEVIGRPIKEKPPKKERGYPHYEDKESFIRVRDEKFEEKWVKKLETGKIKIDRFLRKIMRETKITVPNVASLLGSTDDSVYDQIAQKNPSPELLALLVPEKYLEAVKKAIEPIKEKKAKKKTVKYKDVPSFIIVRDKIFEEKWVLALGTGEIEIDTFLRKIMSATNIKSKTVGSLLCQNHITIDSQINGKNPNPELLALLVPEKYLERVNAVIEALKPSPGVKVDGANKLQGEKKKSVLPNHHL